LKRVDRFDPGDRAEALHVGMRDVRELTMLPNLLRPLRARTVHRHRDRTRRTQTARD